MNCFWRYQRQAGVIEGAKISKRITMYNLKKQRRKLFLKWDMEMNTKIINKWQKMKVR